MRNVEIAYGYKSNHSNTLWIGVIRLVDFNDHIISEITIPESIHRNISSTESLTKKACKKLYGKLPTQYIGYLGKDEQ